MVIRISSLSKCLMVCCALACLLSGQAYGAGTGGSEVMVVAYIPIADCLQLYVADAMGYFREENLTIEMRAMKGGTAIAPAVESGEIQVGWSNTVSIVIAHSKGFDFSFLTPGALEVEGGHRTHSLLVPSDSGVRQISDLSGKKIAINTLGNVNELSLTALMDANGVGKDKIRLVEIPFPDMEAALQHHSVDAALVAEPFVTLSTMHGSAKVLEASAHKSFGNGFMIASWFAKKSWIEKHPEAAARFAAAIRRASEYITRHPEEVSKHLLTATKLSPELVGKIALPAFSATVDLQDLQQTIDLAAKYRFIAAPFPAAEIVSKYAR